VIVLAFSSVTGAPPASPCGWSGNGAVVEAPPLPRPARPPPRHGRLPCQCRQTVGAWRSRHGRLCATEIRGHASPLARRPPPPAKKHKNKRSAGIQRARYAAAQRGGRGTVDRPPGRSSDAPLPPRRWRRRRRRLCAGHRRRARLAAIASDRGGRRERVPPNPNPLRFLDTGPLALGAPRPRPATRERAAGCAGHIVSNRSPHRVTDQRPHMQRQRRLHRLLRRRHGRRWTRRRRHGRQ